MIVTECPPKPISAPGPNLTQEPVRKLCCPLVPITTPISSAESARRQLRRARHAKRREPPTPHFFRPHREWGGKSLGYAMGFESSWAVGESQTLRDHYVRDRMKIGVMEEGLAECSQPRYKRRM